MKHIAIIPARSGSKGLKDKNIMDLDKKPLIAYTIEAAIKSGIFDDVFVSTDSERYAQIAHDYGATTPFLRDKELALDDTSSWDVVQNTLIKFEELGKKFDTFTLLQPTSPLRTEQNVREAFRLFYEKDAVSVVSVCEVEHSPLWCNSLPPSLSMKGFIKSQLQVPRQQLDTYYRINGAIYICKVNEFLTKGMLYAEGCYAYIMPQQQSLDIDTLLDFRIAEALVKEYLLLE